jgi:hypothetical protein
MEDEQAIAWRAMPYRCPVRDASGREIGTAESLLGDEGADIFHGIVVKRPGGQHVEVEAARVRRITRSGVETDLSDSEAASLQPYREQRWYHLGWGGLFRQRPEWDETSST